MHDNGAMGSFEGRETIQYVFRYSNPKTFIHNKYSRPSRNLQTTLLLS